MFYSLSAYQRCLQGRLKYLAHPHTSHQSCLSPYKIILSTMQLLVTNQILGPEPRELKCIHSPIHFIEFLNHWHSEHRTQPGILRVSTVNFPVLILLVLYLYYILLLSCIFFIQLNQSLISVTDYFFTFK